MLYRWLCLKKECFWNFHLNHFEHDITSLILVLMGTSCKPPFLIFRISNLTLFSHDIPGGEGHQKSKMALNLAINADQIFLELSKMTSMLDFGKNWYLICIFKSQIQIWLMTTGGEFPIALEQCGPLFEWNYLKSNISNKRVNGN